MKTYKHDFAKFDLATIRLTERERMVYLRFLWHLYIHEEPIPKERDELVYISWCDDQDMISKVLRLYFDETEDGYTHSYVRRQLNKSQAIRKRMSGVAKASWDKLSKKGVEFWDSLPTHKDYKHKKSPNMLIITFNRKNIDVKKLIEFSKSYFKSNSDPKYWKSPVKIVEEHLQDPDFRYGKDKTNNYTKGVK